VTEQPTTEQPTVAEALARALRRHGVTEAFGQSLPSAFFLAAAQLGIRQISYRTENAGGAMADGYARASGRVTVVGAQNGPAATLLVPPFAEAWKASIPVVGFVQDVATSGRDRNAFQELDHFELFRGCTKWVRQLTDPARVDDYVDMAFTAATSGRPGPVVLLLPKDVLMAPVPDTRARRSAALGRFPLDRTRPSAAAVSEAAQLLATARNPLVIAGGGVHISGASGALSSLRDAASLPVATTTMGKGAVSELHPLSVGVIGSFMGPTAPAHHLRGLVSSADVILLAGTRTNENGTDAWQLLPRDATYISIDIDGGEVNRNYDAVRLPGDALLTLKDLRDSISGMDLTLRSEAAAGLTATIADGRARYVLDAGPLLTSAASPVRPERVMAELDRLLPDDAITVADASYSTIWMSCHLRARRAGQRFISPRGLAGLGWGLPLALGAKAARPDAPVVCIAGDGGFGHVWAELETAVRERLAVTVIVLNNSILGFQKHAELYNFGAHTSAIDFEPVDHAAIARAVGATGVRISDPADIGPALEKALASDTVTLLDVLTDPDAYPPITAWSGHDDILLERTQA
jgi:acetolactate synthase-1/2/3 large subunit